MRLFLLTICFLSVGAGTKMIAQDKKQTPVYLDDTQPMEVRVQDALNRMTVEETTFFIAYTPGKYKRILVVGDNATRNLMLGGGSSELKVQRVISPLTV